MSRLPEITGRDQLPEEKRHIWDEIAGSRGSVRGPFSVLLHSPELAGRAAHLGTYIRFESESTLPARVRELAVLTTARLLDCGYEYAAHRPLAGAAGASEATLRAVHHRRPEELDAGDRWVYDFVEQVLVRHRVTSETFAEAQRRLGRQGVVELAGTIGYYSLLAAALNTFEVEPADIQE